VPPPSPRTKILAAAIIAALPLLVLLIFLQRHLIRGLTAGAVKG
jgi:ABC-type glycerol-3-phosphate transport system permease component